MRIASVITMIACAAVTAGTSLAITQQPATPGAVTLADAVNLNCTLTVPASPLSPAGLATPYQLQATDPAAGPCAMSSPDQRAFVQATVISPGGALAVYPPLVITAGTVPAALPVLPVIPPGSIVAIWVGFNGNTLLLDGAGAGDFVNGLNGDPFGQVSYSTTAPAFFAAALQSAAIPAAGTGLDGQPCPTVRDFSLVDQDQSDNVTSTYRVLADGTTAQDTAANIALGGHRAGNASDNRLLDVFLDPALGCTPFTAPSLADPGAMVTSQGLNELSAAVNQGQPIALVPVNDPMTTAGGAFSPAKTNLYRAGVGQHVMTAPSANGNAHAYCGNIKTVAPARIALDAPFTSVSPSPDPALNLHDFLVARYAASVQILGCKV